MTAMRDAAYERWREAQLKHAEAELKHLKAAKAERLADAANRAAWAAAVNPPLFVRLDDTPDDPRAAAALACTRDLLTMVNRLLLPAHGPSAVASALLTVYGRLVEQSGCHATAREALDMLRTYLDHPGSLSAPRS